MKAIVIEQPGAPEVLKIQERPVPPLHENEVLIKVKAAGVNRPDVAQRKGNYPPPPGAPEDIPGLEVAGLIEAYGGAVKQWKKGDAVCALLSGGGYAEYATAHAGHCLPLPETFTFVDAAALPETVLTVWHNVFQRGGLHAGEHLLVHGGSSGIGVTAIQLAKASGAKVSVTAGSEEKCNACYALGADRCINYRLHDFEEVLKDDGVDIILDMVGGDYIPKNIRLLMPDGRLIFINAMKGGKAEWNALDIMRKRLTITGSTLRNRDVDFKSTLTTAVRQNVWPMIQTGRFRPLIYKTFSLRDASAAHQLMESSQHIGKIVLTIEP